MKRAEDSYRTYLQIAEHLHETTGKHEKMVTEIASTLERLPELIKVISEPAKRKLSKAELSEILSVSEGNLRWLLSVSRSDQMAAGESDGSYVRDVVDGMNPATTAKLREGEAKALREFDEALAKNGLKHSRQYTNLLVVLALIGAVLEPHEQLSRYPNPQYTYTANEPLVKQLKRIHMVLEASIVFSKSFVIGLLKK